MFLGKLRVRGKLALLAAIPLVAVAVLTVPVVLSQARLANRAGETARSVRLAGGVGSLVQDLQQERLLAAGYLVRAADRSDLVEQIARVTDRLTDLRADLGEELPAELSTAVDGIRGLGAVRTQVLDRKLAPEQAVGAFTAVIVRLITSLHLGERLDLSAPGSREVVALDAVLRLDEGINAGAAYLVIATATRSRPAMTLLGSALATVPAGVERVQTFATPEQFSLYTLVQEAFDARAGSDFVAGYAADPGRAVANLSVSTLFPSMLSFITLGRFVERKIATEVTATVTHQQRRALTFAYGAAGIAVAVLLLVLVLSIAVAGAVARPLTRLTRSAERVARLAEEELERVADDEAEAPSQVHLAPVDLAGSGPARDEIGDLALAFERVQQTAARLVQRQVASRRNVAQMFGHVGRRTQNLVGRQIALIDQLERGEEDPGRLRHLYQLDHVSSRLRRNAGSLVVLSGAAGAQPHVAPVQLGDVVRLALGEIEDYTRVDLSVPDDLVLAPALVGDLVLMLAELMENATTFSPPHTRVSVSAARPGTGAGARLTIVDHGLGLPPERLTEENARLARRERLDLAPTEVLGLFVVGRLARRHGMRVTLATTAGGGVTAVVDLAAHMLVPVPVGHPDPPFDVAVLDRASRLLAAGPTWNAFATEEYEIQLPLSDVGQPLPADPELARALVEDVEAGVRRALGEAPDESVVDAAASPARSRALTRRVPGATLPPAAARPAPPPADHRPPDPEQVRTLVEQFEAGVTRALREAGPDHRHEEEEPP